MSSLLVYAQPATGLPDVFVPKESPALLIKKLASVPRLTPVTAASRLEVRPAPDMASSGIATLDALTGGLPRGSLSEVCGQASSGRTSLLLATLAAATRRQEACALVDVSDALDPPSGTAAGIHFKNLLWVRCDSEKQHPPQRHRETEKKSKTTEFDCLDQALKATDLLLQSGGFGLVAIDLGDVPVQVARRIPLTSWFRFRRAVENTPTVLLVIARGSCARTCASLVVELKASRTARASGTGYGPSGKLSAVSSQLSQQPAPAHGQILTGLEVKAEILRSRLERKPAQSLASFMTRTDLRVVNL